MNKKGILGLNTTVLFIVTLLVLSVVAFVLIISVNLIKDTQDVTTTNSSDQLILSNNGTSTVLIPTGEGLTSNLATEKNRTWLDFDGVDDNVLSERYDTISFWYKNETTDWTFIVNSSGTTYVNGSLGTPGLFPIYDNGSNMFLGRLDASNFLNVSIDDFRGYNTTIDAELVNLTYLDGRL